MKLFSLFGRKNDQEPATKLYASIVAQARNPVFYRELGVPDTVDGRFDLIVLHAFVLLYRLKNQGATSKELGQAVFDTLFLDMDDSLREMGVGDLSVGKKVQTMASAFYGRIGAYDAALEADDREALEQALARNIFPDKEAPDVGPLADYVQREVARFAALPLEGIMAGEIAFGTLPASH